MNTIELNSNLKVCHSNVIVKNKSNDNIKTFNLEMTSFIEDTLSLCERIESLLQNQKSDPSISKIMKDTKSLKMEATLHLQVFFGIAHNIIDIGIYEEVRSERAEKERQSKNKNLFEHGNIKQIGE